jgi:Myosin N-terminal SH3-like domain.
MMEKQQVWVPDPVEGFVLGTIEDIGHDGQAMIITADSKHRKVSCNLENIYFAEEHDQKDVEDNCKIC